MALKFSMILQAIDRASAPAKKARASIAGLTSGVRRWGQQVRRMSREIDSGERSLEHYQRRARRLRQVALGSFFQAAAHSARRLAGSVSDVTRRLRLMERAGQGAKGGLKWMGSKALGIAGGAARWGAAAAAGAGGFALFDLFRTAGQFEQYQIMLEGMAGSARKGKEAMSWIQNFAETTPFELDEVTSAFLVLKNAGLDPTNGALRAAGDAAAGMSKDIGQAAEAIADAMTGEFERLKELGITASVQGNKVRLIWVKNEKEFSRVADKSDRIGLAMAVAAAWSDKFAGATERQSRSFFGIISNLRDLWSKFLVMIADAGVFDAVKRKLDEWRARLDSMAKSGQMRDWAKSISHHLERAFNWAVKFVEQTDWPSVGLALGTAVQAMTRLVELFGQAISKFYKFQAYRAARMAENTEKGWFTSNADAAKARKRRQAIEAQYGPLTDSGREEAEAKKSWGQRFYRITPGGPDLPKGAPLDWGSSTKPRGGKYLLLPQGKAAPAKVGGALDINVKVQGPGTARVSRVSSANRDVPIRASVGKVMAAPA